MLASNGAVNTLQNGPVEIVDVDEAETPLVEYDSADQSAVEENADELLNLDDFGRNLFSALRVVDDLEARIAVEGEGEQGGAVVVEDGGFSVGGFGNKAFEVGISVGRTIKNR